MKKKLWELVEMVSDGTMDPYKMFEDSLQRIRTLDPELNMFITINAEEPSIDKKKGLLLGVPVAIKDNISTKGLRTTCASKMLENYIPPYSATVVKFIEKEGGIIIGKTNMDEFAMGALGTNSAFGPTLNPLNKTLSPGGSSSGSAAAVASGAVRIALGSDTGGSIRLPAAWTGTYGLKPTYGAVSRYGLVSYADSMDQIGPIADSIDDLAYIFAVIAGFDERDPTSSYPGISRKEALTVAKESSDPSVLKGKEFYVIKELIEHKDADESMIRAFWNALDAIESEGALVKTVSIPIVLKVPQVYYVIAFSEASSNLARFDGLRYGVRAISPEDIDWDEFFMKNRSNFGWEVKRRILLGSFITSKGYYDMYYSRALKIRTFLRRIFESYTGQNKYVVTPGSLIPPLPIDYDASDLSRLNALDAPMVIPNLLGYPSIVLPAGTVKGYPSSLQIIGRAWSDLELISISKAISEVIRN